MLTTGRFRAGLDRNEVSGDDLERNEVSGDDLVFETCTGRSAFISPSNSAIHANINLLP